MLIKSMAKAKNAAQAEFDEQYKQEYSRFKKEAEPELRAVWDAFNEARQSFIDHVNRYARADQTPPVKAVLNRSKSEALVKDWKEIHRRETECAILRVSLEKRLIREYGELSTPLFMYDLIRELRLDAKELTARETEANILAHKILDSGYLSKVSKYMRELATENREQLPYRAELSDRLASKEKK